MKKCFFAKSTGKHLFMFGAFSSGDIVVLETHPISSDLGGNGNGIIKSSVAL